MNSSYEKEVSTGGGGGNHQDGSKDGGDRQGGGGAGGMVARSCHLPLVTQSPYTLQGPATTSNGPAPEPEPEPAQKGAMGGMGGGAVPCAAHRVKPPALVKSPPVSERHLSLALLCDGGYVAIAGNTTSARADKS